MPLERVSLLVSEAHRRLALVRLAETILLFLAGWLGLLAAAAWQGSLGPGALLAALLAALALASAFWRGARVERVGLARTLDRTLECGGDLLTAYECSTRSAPPSLATLLAEGICARLSRRDVLHASAPSALPFLALPLVALTLLVLARERVSESRTDWILRLSGELQRELALARTTGERAAAEGTLEPETVAHIVAAQARASAMEEEALHGTSGAERARAAAEEIGAELADVGQEIAGGSELAAALARARETAEAAVLGLSGDLGVGGLASASTSVGEARGQAVPGPGTNGPSGSATASHGSAGGAGAGEADSSGGLENAGAGETMAASQPVDTHPAQGTIPAAETSASRGVAVGRSWHAHQATIVQRWIEARRRASLDDHGPDPSSEGE
jgi:hypothetical protein